MLKKDDIIVVEDNTGVLRKGFFCEYVNDKKAVVEVWVDGVIPCHCIVEIDKIYKKEVQNAKN